ncbi:hypothetical protein ACOSP7_002908 [Xanthoceras sorbifolium]
MEGRDFQKWRWRLPLPLPFYLHLSSSSLEMEASSPTAISVCWPNFPSRCCCSSRPNRSATGPTCYGVFCSWPFSDNDFYKLFDLWIIIVVVVGSVSNVQRLES